MCENVKVNVRVRVNVRVEVKVKEEEFKETKKGEKKKAGEENLPCFCALCGFVCGSDSGSV